LPTTTPTDNTHIQSPNYGKIEHKPGDTFTEIHDDNYNVTGYSDEFEHIKVEDSHDLTTVSPWRLHVKTPSPPPRTPNLDLPHQPIQIQTLNLHPPPATITKPQSRQKPTKSPHQEGDKAPDHLKREQHQAHRNALTPTTLKINHQSPSRQEQRKDQDNKRPLSTFPSLTRTNLQKKQFGNSYKQSRIPIRIHPRSSDEPQDHQLATHWSQDPQEASSWHSGKSTTTDKLIRSSHLEATPSLTTTEPQSTLWQAQHPEQFNSLEHERKTVPHNQHKNSPRILQPQPQLRHINRLQQITATLQQQQPNLTPTRSSPVNFKNQRPIKIELDRPQPQPPPRLTPNPTNIASHQTQQLPPPQTTSPLGPIQHIILLGPAQDTDDLAIPPVTLNTRLTPRLLDRIILTADLFTAINLPASHTPTLTFSGY